VEEFEAFDPSTASDEQLTLFLARQGVSPMDVQASLERAVERLKEKAPPNDEPLDFDGQ
jgi:hypothetical protein